MSVVIPVSLFIQIKLACCFHHGFEMRIWHIVGGRNCMGKYRPSFTLWRVWSWRRSLCLWQKSIPKVGVDACIIQVYGRKHDMQESFGAFQLTL